MKALSVSFRASSSETHRTATVTHKLQEVHCPADPSYHMINHLMSHSLFNSILKAAADHLFLDVDDMAGYLVSCAVKPTVKLYLLFVNS